MIYRVERWYSIEDGSGGLWEGGAAAEQIRKGEGSTMKNANRIPETFQTDAEYRQWMERWQQEAREATIEGFKQNRKLNGMTQTELGDSPAEYHLLRERQLQSVAGFYGKDRSGDGEKGTDYIGR